MPVDIQTKILNTFNWNIWWLAMKMLKGTLSDKLSGDSQIFQVWPFFNSLIIINLPLSQQEHVQIFPLFSPSKTCVLPFNFVLVKDPKNIFYYQHDVENYAGVCILMFMGLFNFFFVLQDFIDRIDSYFQRTAFQRNLLYCPLLHKIFPM